MGSQLMLLFIESSISRSQMVGGAKLIELIVILVQIIHKQQFMRERDKKNCQDNIFSICHQFPTETYSGSRSYLYDFIKSK